MRDIQYQDPADQYREKQHDTSVRNFLTQKANDEFELRISVIVNASIGDHEQPDRPS